MHREARSDPGDAIDHPATPQRPPVTLESRLVRHDGGPDRRTIYPPGLADVARMSTWLSADSDAFVDLEAVR